MQELPKTRKSKCITSAPPQVGDVPSPEKEAKKYKTQKEL